MRHQSFDRAISTACLPAAVTGLADEPKYSAGDFLASFAQVVGAIGVCWVVNALA